MAISLQDQLLKAGLSDEKKLKQVKKEKRKQKKQQRGGAEIVDEVKVSAQQALANKSQRDREMAAQQNAAAEKKAVAAQITQMIEVNRQSRDGADIPYNFSDGKLIKKLYVTRKLQDHLSRGRLAIVRSGEGYELLPAQVAEKIQQRDPDRVVLQVTQSAPEAQADDPYADYKIPDDLMW
jgi:uncharacterized protein YaiL (DUF2058 family)